MKERKQFYIFFVESDAEPWVQNDEILNLFMNKIAIDEDDQSEIFAVKYLKSWRGYGLSHSNMATVKQALKGGFSKSIKFCSIRLRPNRFSTE